MSQVMASEARRYFEAEAAFAEAREERRFTKARARQQAIPGPKTPQRSQ